jgi:dienelactone hydrolase
MTSTACINAGAPVPSSYEGSGKFITLGENLPAYESGKGGAKGVLIIPDIFGFDHPNVFRFTDRVASMGYHAVAIDPFIGKPWPLAKFPPKPEDNIGGWLAEQSQAVDPYLSTSISYLKSQGISNIGSVGFCWGATQSFKLGKDVSLACAGFHPGGIELDLIRAIKVPIMAIPCQGDCKNLPEIIEAVNGMPWAKHAVIERFDDQVHGYMAARGDWNDKATKVRVEQAFTMLEAFLGAHV